MNIDFLRISDQALSVNFQRLRDLLLRIPDTDSGTASVTGTLDIDTDLESVSQVLVSLESPPTAGGCFLRASPVGGVTPSRVTIQVYDSAFVQSVVAKDVAWLALG